MTDKLKECKITRSIYMNRSLKDSIQRLSDKNRRNWNLQVLYMLENQLKLEEKKRR